MASRRVKGPRPRLWSALGLAVLCGCVQSAVPSLDASDFKQPALAELEPRALALRVRDQRPVSAEDRQETEQHLQAVLGQLLGGAGVSVTPQARFTLDILLRFPERTERDMDPMGCVEMVWELRSGDTLASTSTNSSCSSMEDGYGAASPNVSRAFRRSLRAQLSDLDRATAEAVALSAPLEFEPAQITVPPLAWLSSRTVALNVEDELDATGTAGAALTRSLTEVLPRSGLVIKDDAPQRLSLRLARPKAANSDHERRVCVELQAELKAASARRVVHRQDCPRRGAPLGPRLLNGALLGLDSL